MPESKAGGIKTSTSAPSNLPSTKISQKSSLFNDDDEDDLFAQTKTSRYLQLEIITFIYKLKSRLQLTSYICFKVTFTVVLTF